MRTDGGDDVESLVVLVADVNGVVARRALVITDFLEEGSVQRILHVVGRAEIHVVGKAGEGVHSALRRMVANEGFFGNNVIIHIKAQQIIDQRAVLQVKRDDFGRLFDFLFFAAGAKDAGSQNENGKNQ